MMASMHGQALGWRQATQTAQLTAGRRCAARPAPKAARIVMAASKLAEVPQAPPDPILGISEAFKASDSPDKLNLGVGAYRTEELKPLVLEVVKKAERQMLERGDNKEYLPIEGLAEFRKATIDLMLGPSSKAAQEGRVACLQSLSGTGSLRIGAAFIAKFLPGTKVFVSNPTWGNHNNIFADAGVTVEKYRYFDPETVGLDFEGMLEDIRAAPEGSVILLHGCAHNPTGIDPTEEQWQKIADLVQEKNHLPFFDIAYQGFATGSLDQDAAAPRLFVDRGIEALFAQSYSKNLGLYAERVGAFTYVGNDKETTTKVLSQCKRIARAIYSNPPVHGARIVAEVVGDEATFNEWRAEMEGMAGRIKTVRQELYDHLTRINPDKDWSFIINQIGMFSFTGLTPAQVENMTNKHQVYMTKDGRISMAGLNSARAEYLAKAIDDSVRNF
jgi:aspartate aminotransferase